jgi:hypothetical protein
METFIVRLQPPGGEEPESALRGLVESLGAREARSFKTATELVALLRDLLEAARTARATGSSSTGSGS